MCMNFVYFYTVVGYIKTRITSFHEMELYKTLVVMGIPNGDKEVDDHSIKWDDLLTMMQIIPSYMSYCTAFTIYNP